MGFSESLPISRTQRISQCWRLSISSEGPLKSMKSYGWLPLDFSGQGGRSAGSPRDPGTPGSLYPGKAYRNWANQGAETLNLSVLRGRMNRANQLQMYLPSLFSSFPRSPSSHLYLRRVSPPLRNAGGGQSHRVSLTT